MSCIENFQPLETRHLPTQLKNRNELKSALNQEFGSDLNSASNMFILGPRGTGKTHFIRKLLEDLPHNDVASCYVNCRQSNTQYKGLSQILSVLTDEEIDTGHHVSSLQRQLQNRVGIQPLLVVLDDLEFLVQNDGSDLLYFLSRLSDSVRLILTSSSPSALKQVDGRAISSLLPRSLELSEYSEKQAFSILADRAEAALASHSLHNDALQSIVDTTRNISIGLYWLQVAGQRRNTITTTVVEDVKPDAFRRYLDDQLQEFSVHHRLVLQAVMELLKESPGTVRTGKVYSRYKALCDVYSEDSVSQRSISDVLTELELLQFIDAEYFRGGQHGKTRKISLSQPFTADSEPIVHS
ncbi:Cdc6/Cdc18 family protein [Halobium salinum]|uniref:Cdc6/Cdc18 family protein n=1 Tax=Halobium salinum TaxID=1364940 RepID=A0ABD5PEQ6_9EURY|nr:AAA family ATPase [Halobium salinum]